MFLETKRRFLWGYKGQSIKKIITVIHIIACNSRAPKYMKQKLSKLKREKKTIQY